MMIGTTKRWFPVILSIPINAIAILCAYWFVFDSKPPSRLIYQHEKFLSQPASSRSEAKLYEIDSASQGDTVYRYLEWCLDHKREGIIRRSWSDGVVYQMPERSTIGVVGCHSASIPQEIPGIYPDRYKWSQRIIYKLNPLTTISVEYPTIDLKIVSRKGERNG